MHTARLLGTLPNGQRVYRFTVDILANNSRLCATVATARVTVDAASPRDALRLVRDELADRPETELHTYGPKGGKHSAFIGWYSAVEHAMRREVLRRQLPLGLSLNAA